MGDEKVEELLRVERDGPIVRSVWDTQAGLLEALAAVLSVVVGDGEMPLAVRANAAVLLSAIRFPRTVESLVHSEITDPR